MSRFRAVMLGAVVLIALVTIGVVVRGDRTEPTPIAHAPADGDAGTSAGTGIVLRFSRPVDADAVRAHLRIDPPVPGSVEVDRNVARFTPARRLRSETRYQVTLRAGFADTTGRALGRDFHFAFQTRPPTLLFSQPERSGPGPAGSHNLWTVGLDGEAPRRITDHPGGMLFVSPAPDGDRLVYTAPDPNRRSAVDLWLANLDGSGRRRLLAEQDGTALSVNWSPRGDLIAVEWHPRLSEEGDLGRPRIIGVQSDGSTVGPLYGRGEETAVRPSWSPDGRRLAFYERGQQAVGISDLVGGVALAPAVTSSVASWSPDGSRLTFADSRLEDSGERFVVKVVGADGEPWTELNRPGFSDLFPSWSPDGRRIAVVGKPPEGIGKIWLLDPNGSSAVEIEGSEGRQHGAPLWSPDGSYLAYSRLAPSSAGGVLGESTWELWVARGDGTDARRLPIDGFAEAWAP